MFRQFLYLALKKNGIPVGMQLSRHHIPNAMSTAIGHYDFKHNYELTATHPHMHNANIGIADHIDTTAQTRPQEHCTKCRGVHQCSLIY